MQQVTITDGYQKNYTYTRSEVMGENFDPLFKPQVAPKEMLELGVFGGLYFGDKPAEFPLDWWISAKLSTDGIAHRELNYYKVLASQSRAIWQEKGWIHADDPRGWFQWYCRYYMGRRHEDDTRQIKRWRAITRHLAQIHHNCREGDQFCRPKQRQAVLQWAYDPRKI